MPLFDFVCKACDNEFEVLVRGSAAPVCPACGSAELERQLSMPNVKSEGTHRLAMAAAKRRDARQGYERTQTQLEYEKNHDD